MTQTDGMLALLAADGDTHAFGVLEGRFQHLLRWAGRTYFAPGLDRADIVQEARLGLFKACCSYQPGRNLGGFAAFAKLCIERNVLTVVKAQQRHKHEVLNGATSLQRPFGDDDTATLEQVLPGPAGDDPVDQVIARERLATVLAAARRLSYLEQTVLARRLHGASLAEAGEGLGSSLQGSAKTADNALQRVRRKIADELAA